MSYGDSMRDVIDANDMERIVRSTDLLRTTIARCGAMVRCLRALVAVFEGDQVCADCFHSIYDDVQHSVLGFDFHPEGHFAFFESLQFVFQPCRHRVEDVKRVHDSSSLSACGSTVEESGRDGLGRTTASADDPPGSSSVPPGG